MIFIKKNKHPPVVKFTKAGHANNGKIKWKIGRKKLIKDFKNNPRPFNNGKYAFSFDYGRRKFREKLLSIQGSKCCFCEKPLHNGAIEHFRPKAAWQQATENPFNRPGYYWLAYSWDNMLISCTECNSSGQKGNLFPINGARGIYPSDCSTEDKVLINPTSEDPSICISFNLDQPIGIDAAGRGNENIRIFKLKDRGDIKTIRHDHLMLYKTQKDIAALPNPVGAFTAQRIRKAKAYLKTAQNPKELFSGMIVENIKKGLI
jgi:uncharacterized protein (TIGR02646 family)